MTYETEEEKGGKFRASGKFDSDESGSEVSISASYWGDLE